MLNDVKEEGKLMLGSTSNATRERNNREEENLPENEKGEPAMVSDGGTRRQLRCLAVARSSEVAAGRGGRQDVAGRCRRSAGGKDQSREVS